MDVLARLRALPAAAPMLAALEGVPGVWVVGGAVRDVLLGREPAEVDLVVEGDAVAVAGGLGGEVVVHERFGTATVRLDGVAFDLAGARGETYERPGALPAVRLGVDLREDLARRDFTVNTMAVRLDDGRFVAWEGAEEDLAAGLLRVLHARSFVDDPTRLLRLARYSARLGFVAEGQTEALARAAVSEGAVRTVSGARLGNELRLLLREPQPAAVVALAARGLGGAVVHPGFAADPDVVARALALCPDDGRADLLALAACCLEVPRNELALRLDALAFRRGDRDTVLVVAAGAQGLAEALEGASDAPAALWALLRREAPETVALAGALGSARAEGLARRFLEELRGVRLAIRGEDLLAAGLAGPAVGAALQAALVAALEGRAPTREAQLAAALEGVR